MRSNIGMGGVSFLGALGNHLRTPTALLTGMPTQIRQLVDLLSKSLATLEAACAANGTEIPDLSESFHPDSEVFREDPAAAEAANIIGAAALQLAAIVIPPQMSLYHIVGGVS